MALWMVRTGGHGEHEKRFVETNRIYATWKGFKHDLSAVGSRQDLERVLREVYPEKTKGLIANHFRQLWASSHEMKAGDWVAVPSKIKPVINVAKINRPYVFDPSADDPYYHYRVISLDCEEHSAFQLRPGRALLPGCAHGHLSD